jgi:tRNA (guanine-N7-)-methyltransferase
VTVRRAKRLPLEELAPVLLELPEPASPYRWSDVFGNAHPVEIEVGCGKGLFLLTATAAAPDVNFLGIEIVRKYQLFAATRLFKRGTRNVRLACADARVFVRDRVPHASIQAIHVYFPDPWWKKRHQKRRLFTADFAALCENALRPGGILHVATDVADYHEMVQTLLAEHTRLQPLPSPEEKPAAHDLDYLSNFERKARKAGKPIYRGDYRRTGAVAAFQTSAAPL